MQNREETESARKYIFEQGVLYESTRRTLKSLPDRISGCIRIAAGETREELREASISSLEIHFSDMIAQSGRLNALESEWADVLSKVDRGMSPAEHLKLLLTQKREDQRAYGVMKDYLASHPEHRDFLVAEGIISAEDYT